MFLETGIVMRDPVQTGLKIWDIFVSISCIRTLRATEVVFCFLVNSPIYSFLYQSLCFDSVLLSLSNRAFSSNRGEGALGAARCFLLTGWRRPRSGFKENSWLEKLSPNENYSFNFRKGYY